MTRTSGKAGWARERRKGPQTKEETLPVLTLSRGPRAGQDVRSYVGLKWDGRRRLGSPGLNGSIISASHGVYLYISGKEAPMASAAKGP